MSSRRTPSPSFYRAPRLRSWALLCALVCCLTPFVIQAQSAPQLSTLVTGVGVTDEGELAVRFQGAWFSLKSTPTGWESHNAVSATEIAVAPQDSQTSRPSCVCVPAERGACTRQEQIEQCGTEMTTIVEQTRTYTVFVGPWRHVVRAHQTIENTRAIVATTGLRLGFRSDMSFDVRSRLQGAEVGDDSEWVLGLKPRRSLIDCNFSEAELEAINAAAEVTTTSGTQNCTGSYSTEVQLSFARTESLAGARERVTPSNEAATEALKQMMPVTGSAYLGDSEPEAYGLSGTMLDHVEESATGDIWDLDRLSRFYLKGRDLGGYSDNALERPLLNSFVPRNLSLLPQTGRSWRFSHTIINQSIRFPVLAGICGFEAFIRSSINGSVQYGNNACFNGWVQAVSFNGQLSFDAEAGAGGYCNILIASASAGLTAGVGTGIEFSSQLETLPPALSVSVNQYLDARFKAYFQTRILFWSKRWERTVMKRRVWQRGVNYRLVEEVNAPQLCSLERMDFPDMFLQPLVRWMPPGGGGVGYDPPIPSGATVVLQLVVPSYHTGVSLNTKIQPERGAPITPTQVDYVMSIPRGDVYNVYFPVDALPAKTSRVRLERDEYIPGTSHVVKHLSNWREIERLLQ